MNILYFCFIASATSILYASDSDSLDLLEDRSSPPLIETSHYFSMTGKQAIEYLALNRPPLAYIPPIRQALFGKWVTYQDLLAHNISPSIGLFTHTIWSPSHWLVSCVRPTPFVEDLCEALKVGALEHLNVDTQYFSDADFKAFEDAALASGQSLKTLILSGAAQAKEPFEIAAKLLRVNMLVSLEINIYADFPNADYYLKKLAKTLAINRSLRHLKLSGISTNAAIYLAYYLGQNPTLISCKATGSYLSSYDILDVIMSERRR